MSNCFDRQTLAGLFVPETHHQYSGQVFDRAITDRVLEISHRAYQAQAKRFGAVALSSSENLTYLSLLETWLGADANLCLHFGTEQHDSFQLAVGEAEPIKVPIHRSGIRWLMNIFVDGCAAGPPTEHKDPFDQTYKYIARIPLLDSGNLELYADTIPDKEAEPVTPVLALLSPPILPEI